MATKNEYKQTFEPALQWFKNKALRAAEAAIDQLAVAAERGYWLPEDKSRSIRAALNKSTIAQGTARNHALGFSRAKWGTPVAMLGHCMEFGLFEQAQSIDIASIKVPELSDPELTAAEAGIRYAKSFKYVALAMARLDDTRPKPVFTYLGASPTVSRTLEGLGLHVKPEAKVCEVEYKEVELFIGGKTVRGWTCRLLWPVGTVHGASRWHHEDSQCEACGHGIKRDNWVPLILHNEAGTPYSLWSGRDCARTIFGIKVTGEMRLDLGNDPHVPQPDGTAISVAPAQDFDEDRDDSARNPGPWSIL